MLPQWSDRYKLDALAFMVRMLLSRVPDFDQWERDRGHPMLKQPMLATNSLVLYFYASYLSRLT